MQVRKNVGQSSVELATIITLVMVGLIVGGPFLLRSISAHFKSWDDQVQDSQNDPLLQASPEEADIHRPCTCSDWIAGSCAVNGVNVSCQATERYFYKECAPIGCEVSLPPPNNTSEDCRHDVACCTVPTPGDCGTGTGAANDCPVGNRIHNYECGGNPVVDCVNDSFCLPVCQGALTGTFCPGDNPPDPLNTPVGGWQRDFSTGQIVVSMTYVSSLADCNRNVPDTDCEFFCNPGYVFFAGICVPGCNCPAGTAFQGACGSGYIEQGGCTSGSAGAVSNSCGCCPTGTYNTFGGYCPTGYYYQGSCASGEYDNSSCGCNASPTDLIMNYAIYARFNHGVRYDAIGSSPRDSTPHNSIKIENSAPLTSGKKYGFLLMMGGERSGYTRELMLSGLPASRIPSLGYNYGWIHGSNYNFCPSLLPSTAATVANPLYDYCPRDEYTGMRFNNILWNDENVFQGTLIFEPNTTLGYMPVMSGTEVTVGQSDVGKGDAVIYVFEMACLQSIMNNLGRTFTDLYTAGPPPPPPPPSTCPNGTCDPGETCSSCWSDCNSNCCGDSSCDISYTNENCRDCTGDCGACPSSCPAMSDEYRWDIYVDQGILKSTRRSAGGWTGCENHNGFCRNAIINTCLNAGFTSYILGSDPCPGHPVNVCGAASCVCL